MGLRVQNYEHLWGTSCPNIRTSLRIIMWISPSIFGRFWVTNHADRNSISVKYIDLHQTLSRIWVVCWSKLIYFRSIKSRNKIDRSKNLNDLFSFYFDVYNLEFIKNRTKTTLCDVCWKVNFTSLLGQRKSKLSRNYPGECDPKSVNFHRRSDIDFMQYPSIVVSLGWCGFFWSISKKRLMIVNKELDIYSIIFWTS